MKIYVQRLRDKFPYHDVYPPYAKIIQIAGTRLRRVKQWYHVTLMLCSKFSSVNRCSLLDRNGIRISRASSAIYYQAHHDKERTPET